MSFEQYFWGEDQGYQYRRFTNTRAPLAQVQLFRYIAVVILLFWLIVGFFVDEPFGQFIYMTTWGSYLSFFSLLLNIFATDDQVNNPGKVVGWQFWRWRTAVWFFEMALTFDVMITVSYWTLIYSHQPHHKVVEWYTVWIHILPLVSSLIDFYLTRWRFRMQRFVTVLAIGVIYGIFNFTYVRITGEPIYDVLTWESWSDSLLLMFGLLVLLSGTFWAFWRLSFILSLSSKSPASVQFGGNFEYLISSNQRNVGEDLLHQFDAELGQTLKSTYVPINSNQLVKKKPIMVYVPKDY
jgi:hypothetical protein